MQSLGLDVEVLSEEGKEVKVDTEQDEIMKTVEELGIDLIGHEALNLEFDQEEETEEEDYYGDGDEDFMDKDSFDEMSLKILMILKGTKKQVKKTG